MPLILTKKIGSSNKNQTLPETTGPSPDSQHPIPFIDKISVIVTPPHDNASALHNHIYSSLQNPSYFSSSQGTSGGFTRSAKLVLDKVPDPKKWPLFQYKYVDSKAAKFRMEFVPADMGVDGFAQFHAVMGLLFDGGWTYFAKHGRVTRIDIAVDFYGRTMSDFSLIPQQGMTHTQWGLNGQLQTAQFGKSKGTHTSIYDRKAKRIAKGQKGYADCVRVERRLKNPSIVAVCDLKAFPNPFAHLQFSSIPATPPLEELKSPYIWTLFRHTAEKVGVASALAMLPANKKTVSGAFLPPSVERADHRSLAAAAVKGPDDVRT